MSGDGASGTHPDGCDGGPSSRPPAAHPATVAEAAGRTRIDPFDLVGYVTVQPDVILAVVLAIAGVPVAWANTVLHVLALTVAVATATALVVAASRLPGHPARFHTGRPRRTSG